MSISSTAHSLDNLDEKSSYSPARLSTTKFENGVSKVVTAEGEYTAEEEAALTKKLDWYLIPGLTVLYLFSFVDRTSIGAANIGGFLKDIGLGDYPSAFNNALALYFAGYVLFEIPANLAIKRFNPKIILPSLCVGWGILSICQGFITNETGLYWARFCLGISEAGLFPGCLFVISLYYTREQRPLRIAIFFGGAALAGAFSGIVAYLVLKMDGVGGVHGWQWLFFIPGAITVLFGISGYWWAPPFPEKADFLNAREKSILSARIRNDLECATKEPFSWSKVRSALVDTQILLYCALFHAFSYPLYSLSLFLPTIIKQLGYASWQAQLLSTPPYIIAFFALISVAYYSHGHRLLSIILGGAFAIIGYIILIAATSGGVRYFGSIIAVVGTYVSISLLLGLPVSNVQNQTSRAVAGGAQIFLGDLGAIVGVLVYQPHPNLNSNLYRIPNIIAIAYIFGGILIAGVLWTLLRRDNFKMVKESEREEGEERKQNYLYHL